MQYRRGLLAIATIAISCSAQAIVNGLDISAKVFPSVAKILITAYNSNAKKIEYSCTGVFLSDSLLLTAGHCAPGGRSGILVKPNGIELYSFGDKPLAHPVRAVAIYSNFDLSAEEMGKRLTKRDQGLKQYATQAPGCYSVRVPLLSLDTVDLSVVKFPKNTSANFEAIDFGYRPRLTDNVQYVGFGINVNPFDGSSFLLFSGLETQKRLGAGSIMRISDIYAATKAPVYKTYAAQGDSGSPVFFKNRLIGIMSYIDQNCESEYGGDYGILNAFTYLSAKKSIQFLQNALHFLIKI